MRHSSSQAIVTQNISERFENLRLSVFGCYAFFELVIGHKLRGIPLLPSYCGNLTQIPQLRCPGVRLALCNKEDLHRWVVFIQRVNELAVYQTILLPFINFLHGENQIDDASCRLLVFLHLFRMMTKRVQRLRRQFSIDPNLFGLLGHCLENCSGVWREWDYPRGEVFR